MSNDTQHDTLSLAREALDYHKIRLEQANWDIEHGNVAPVQRERLIATLQVQISALKAFIAQSEVVEEKPDELQERIVELERALDRIYNIAVGELPDDEEYDVLAVIADQAQVALYPPEPES